MRKFVIGVDGGNTKTDYFLFDTEGNFVDHLKGGTCSHEALADSFEGAYRLLKMHLDLLVNRNGLTYDDIESAAFGLAGVDLPHQRTNLEAIVEKIGFKNYVVDNDSFLGIKASLPNGYGVCSINGTGMATGGIDEYGNRLQVGGMGSVTGDEAGGGYIATTVLRYVYDQLYRCSTKTMMTDRVLKLLDVSDKYYYTEAFEKFYEVGHTPFIQCAFDCADLGDEAAIELLDNVALQLAKSCAGCINELQFEDEVDVVLAGSVWVKPSSTFLIDTFKDYVASMAKVPANILMLKIPPATGAVLWALELAHSKPVDEVMRQNVVTTVEEIFLKA